MTKQELLCCLFEGGLQEKVRRARLSFENVEGEGHHVVFQVPPHLFDILKLLEERGDPCLLGHRVVPASGSIDIKMVKEYDVL